MGIQRIVRYTLAITLLLWGCGGKNPPPPPLNFDDYEEEIVEESNVVEVPYMVQNGVRIVNVKVNGVAMNMIFDTGASGVSISQVEAAYLVKQGLLTEEDLVGETQMQIADGSVVAGMVVRLKSVVIGEGLLIENVVATVVMNQQAPLLLGNTAIAGRFEVDDTKGIIRFYLD